MLKQSRIDISVFSVVSATTVEIPSSRSLAIVWCCCWMLSRAMMTCHRARVNSLRCWNGNLSAPVIGDVVILAIPTPQDRSGFAHRAAKRGSRRAPSVRAQA
jgi:hypothetical protein